jgi:VWA domain-containing protein
VQEAVAAIIRKEKAETGIPALIRMLRTGGLRIIETARLTLEEITGEHLGIDPDAWESWYERKLKGETQPKNLTDDVGSVATYYGLKVFSDRVLFILDVSGSMDAGEPPRIETAREEIIKTLKQLNKRTLVNVVGFGSGARWWRDEEVPATPENLADAEEFVTKLPVGGGTNISDTFEEAFEKNRRMDTIFFLGDGSPSLGRHTEQEEILARIRWMNRFRKVRIHTIALIRGEVGRFGGRMGPGLGRGRSRSGERAYDEEEAARFLARLAAQNGGSAVKIDD